MRNFVGQTGLYQTCIQVTTWAVQCVTPPFEFSHGLQAGSWGHTGEQTMSGRLKCVPCAGSLLSYGRADFCILGPSIIMIAICLTAFYLQVITDVRQELPGESLISTADRVKLERQSPCLWSPATEKVQRKWFVVGSLLLEENEGIRLQLDRSCPSAFMTLWGSGKTES